MSPHLLGQIVFQANVLDSVELRLQPVHVLLGFRQDRFEDLTRPVILEPRTQLNRGIVMLNPSKLEF